MRATHGRTLVLADGPWLARDDDPWLASFTAGDLARTVRRHMGPAFIVAMVRYWSRLGVGSHAALEAARDRTAVTPEPAKPARHRGSHRGDRPGARRG